MSGETDWKRGVLEEITGPPRRAVKWVRDSLSTDPERQRFMREAREQNRQARAEKMASRKNWVMEIGAEMRKKGSAAGSRLMKMFEKSTDAVATPPPPKRSIDPGAVRPKGDLMDAPKNIDLNRMRRKKALSGDED